MKYTLIVVIVNWNTKDITSSCVRSVLPCIAPFNGLIVLIDNNSSDGSVEHFNNEFSGNQAVKIIANQENVGFAKANNYAIRSFNAEYFLLLNSDTLIKEDPIKSCINFLEKNINVGLIGCKLLNRDMSIQISCASFLRILTPLLGKQFTASFLRQIAPKTAYRYIVAYPGADHNKFLYPEWIMGAFMFFRGDLLKKIDGFDEQYFMYLEDMDICRKIHNEGYKVAYLPDCSVIHYGGSSSSHIPVKTIKRNIASRFIFFCKFHNNLVARLFLIMELLGIFLDILITSLLLIVPFKKTSRNFNQTSTSFKCYLKAIVLPATKLRKWGI